MLLTGTMCLVAVSNQAFENTLVVFICESIDCHMEDDNVNLVIMHESAPERLVDDEQIHPALRRSYLLLF